LLAGKDVKPILQKLMSEREPLYRDVADLTVASTGGSAKRLANSIAEQLRARAGMDDDQ
jgi:shikimate kinase